MSSAFRTASASVLEVTAQSLISRDRGFYVELFVKGSDQLRTMLKVDREILVLLSNFRDQQARTLQAAATIVRRSDRRLEPTVVIVGHKDQSGNQKLRTWGRERGITVLPVFFGAEPLPSGELFERLLCSELFTHDPFDVTGPVADDDEFFGRRTEAEDIARKLQRGEIRAAFGIRKMGKTSLLHRTLRVVEARHDSVVVVIDCSLDALWSLRAPQLIASIARAIRDATESESRYSAVRALDITVGTESAQGLLTSAIEGCRSPLTIFFDEIDYITPSSPTSPHWRTDFNTFWRTVRAVYQENRRRAGNVGFFVTGVSSKWFSEGTIDGVENAALALIPEEYLDPLPRDSSVTMLQTLGARGGIMLTDSAAQRVAAACSDMPFWMRKCGSFLHSRLNEGARAVELEESEIDLLVREFVQTDGAATAEVALAHLFRIYPELGRACIECAHGRGAEQPLALLRALSKYGLIDLTARTLSGDLVAAAVSLHTATPEDDAPLEIDRQTDSMSLDLTLNEWAEELSVLSRRRNLLEKRLRDLVLGFVRFDSTNNPDKGSLHERLLRVIPEERRANLARLRADEAIETFYWLELTALVRREWGLFQSIFGDKREFEQMAKLVNDRPDTHAKDFDLADIALYRRALGWLEGGVEAK